MGGLSKLCKLYGGIKATDKDGNTVHHKWDYANDCAVTEAEMPQGSERWKASERAKWEGLRDKEQARKEGK